MIKKSTSPVLLVLFFFFSCSQDKKIELDYTPYYDIYSLSQINDSIWKDTLLYGSKTDPYNRFISPMLLDIKDDYGHRDSLFPESTLSKVEYSKSPSIFSKSLSINQINNLLETINNPINLGWGETTYQAEGKFKFYNTENKLIAVLSHMSNNYIKVEYIKDQKISRNFEYKKFKFGELRGKGVTQFNNVLKEL